MTNVSAPQLRQKCAQLQGIKLLRFASDECDGHEKYKIPQLPQLPTAVLARLPHLPGVLEPLTWLHQLRPSASCPHGPATMDPQCGW